MTERTFEVVWSPEAEHDLLWVWRRGAEKFSPAIADKHLRDIHAAAMRLSFAPLIGRERADLRPGVREIVVHPTIVFYRATPDAVEIIRVVDGRRNLPALFGAD